MSQSNVIGKKTKHTKLIDSRTHSHKGAKGPTIIINILYILKIKQGKNRIGLHVAASKTLS